MVGCADYNCLNRSEEGFRIFRFPADPERKKKWIINCRRDRWNPNANSRLCEISVKLVKNIVLSMHMQV